MITYTNQTDLITVQYPLSWDPTALTGLTLTIADTAGNELMSATAATLKTATSLSAAAQEYATELYLSAGAPVLAPRDIIRLSGIYGGSDHVVKGYDATNRIVTVEDMVGRDYEVGADVYGLNATCAVDLSDTDVFAPGTQLVLTWTPTGTGAPFMVLAEIERLDQLNVASFVEDFRALYPRAYDALSEPADRLRVILRNAQDRLRLQLSVRGLDIARVKDQRLLSPPLMALVAMTWTLNGDEKLLDERKTFGAEYDSLLEELCALPLWVDSDDDDVADDGETTTYPQYFERAW